MLPARVAATVGLEVFSMRGNTDSLEGGRVEGGAYLAPYSRGI